MKLGSDFKIHKNQCQVCCKGKLNNEPVEDYMEDYLCGLEGRGEFKHFKVLTVTEKIILSTLKLATSVTQGSLKKVQRQTWNGKRSA